MLSFSWFWTPKYGHLFLPEWKWCSPYWLYLFLPKCWGVLSFPGVHSELLWVTHQQNSGLCFGLVLFPSGFTRKLDGVVWSKALNEWPSLHSREPLVPHETPFQGQEETWVDGFYDLCECAFFFFFFVTNSNSWKCSCKLWIQKAGWRTEEVFCMELSGQSSGASVHAACQLSETDNWVLPCLLFLQNLAQNVAVVS